MHLGKYESVCVRILTVNGHPADMQILAHIILADPSVQRLKVLEECCCSHICHMNAS